MIFIYIFFFLITFWFKYKKSGFSTSAFLLFIYLISSIAAAILLYGYDKYRYSTITLSSVLFSLTYLTLFFAPLVAFDNFDIRKIKFPASKLMILFAWFVIVLCLSSLLTSLADGIKVFFYSDLGQARLDVISGKLIEGNRIFLISYLGGYGTQLSLYALILYFYFRKFIPNTRYIQILLFISSFQIVIVNLTVIGRDGIVRWIFFLIFCLSLFRQVLTRKDFKQIFINLLLVFSPFILIFIAISTSRAQLGGVNAFEFIIDYIGQPFINLSRIFSDFQEPTFYGRLNFPFFFPSSEAVPILNLSVYKSSGSLNVFGTFISSFLMDFGAYYLLLFAFLFFIVAKFSFRKGSKSFTQLIMYCWFLQVFLLGVFYYMFTTPMCIRVFFILLFLSLLMQIASISKRVFQSSGPRQIKIKILQHSIAKKNATILHNATNVTFVSKGDQPNK